MQNQLNYLYDKFYTQAIALEKEISSKQNLQKEDYKHISQLNYFIDLLNKYKTLEQQLKIAEKQLIEFSKDIELKEIAQEELDKYKHDLLDTEQNIYNICLQDFDSSENSCTIEIYPGAGGDESSLFARELLNMYENFSKLNNWNTEIVDMIRTDVGGIKSVSLSVTGNKCYTNFLLEAGVHRVQRVPKTEASGRIHTSTVTVLVLPEKKDVKITLNPELLEFKVCRSSGPGGQSVNTTDSAVHVSYKYDGEVISVFCQEQKSQLGNKKRALDILISKIQYKEEQKKQQELSKYKQSQASSADRSQKFRTYNYHRNTIEDHRLGVICFLLTDALRGEKIYSDFINDLIIAHRNEQIKHWNLFDWLKIDNK